MNPDEIQAKFDSMLIERFPMRNIDPPIKLHATTLGGVHFFGRNCTVTGKMYLVGLTDEDIEGFRSCEHVQDMISFTAPQREFIKSNITPAEWDHLFGENE